MNGISEIKRQNPIVFRVGVRHYNPKVSFNSNAAHPYHSAAHLESISCVVRQKRVKNF